MKRLSLILFLSIFSILFFAGVVAAATVTIEPSKTLVRINDTFNLNVYVSNASDLYGASVDLMFDPKVVKISTDGSIPETGEGAVFMGQALPVPGYIINRFDNTSGTMNFAELLVGNVSGVNISNKTLIATIPLKAVGIGSVSVSPAAYDADISSLGLSGSTMLIHLADSSAQPISYSSPQNIVIQSKGSNNTNLSSITYDGTPIDGFSPAIFNYNVSLPAGTVDIPVVEAMTEDSEANVSITKASSLTGSTKQRTATITVTAQDGTQSQYTVTFSEAAAPLSDLLATAGNGQVTLTFTAPAGASSVTLMQKTGTEAYSQNTSVSLDANSTGATVTGLTNGTAYSFKLVVVGGPFAGESNESTVTPTGDSQNGTLSGTIATPSSTTSTAGLAGVSVTLIGTSYSALTDANGVYVIPNVPAGDYILSYSKDGYLQDQKNVTVTADTTGTYDATAYLWGDVNGDGSINVSDATEITKNFVKGIPLAIPTVADVNKDGTINISDATAIVKFFVKATPLSGNKE